MAPANSKSFSVSVVLPASGCEMMAKVRRCSTRSARTSLDVSLMDATGRELAACGYCEGAHFTGSTRGSPPTGISKISRLDLKCASRRHDSFGRKCFTLRSRRNTKKDKEKVEGGEFSEVLGWDWSGLGSEWRPMLLRYFDARSHRFPYALLSVSS